MLACPTLAEGTSPRSPRLNAAGMAALYALAMPFPSVPL